MDELVKYALSFTGQSYRWGGDDPTGWDCSGFVQEILSAVGEDPAGDQTSHSLYLHFKKYGTIRTDGLVYPGDLAFFGKPYRIIHVAFCIDRYRMVEAGGGGRHVISSRDAAIHNAYIRVRPLDNREDLVKIISPKYQYVW